MQITQRKIFGTLPATLLLLTGTALTARFNLCASAANAPAAGPQVSQNGWRLANPVSYENLTVFPVVAAQDADTSKFATLDEALASGEALITEQGAEMRRMRDLEELTPEQMTCFIKPRWSEELYDIDADPQELKNLIADPNHAGDLAELRKALDQWQHETSDSVPKVRPPDLYDRETGAPLTKKAALSTLGALAARLIGKATRSGRGASGQDRPGRRRRGRGDLRLRRRRRRPARRAGGGGGRDRY